MKRLSTACLSLLAIATFAAGVQAAPTVADTITITIRGLNTEEDAKIIKESLAKLDIATFNFDLPAHILVVTLTPKGKLRENDVKNALDGSKYKLESFVMKSPEVGKSVTFQLTGLKDAKHADEIKAAVMKGVSAKDVVVDVQKSTLTITPANTITPVSKSKVEDALKPTGAKLVTTDKVEVGLTGPPKVERIGSKQLYSVTLKGVTDDKIAEKVKMALKKQYGTEDVVIDVKTGHTTIKTDKAVTADDINIALKGTEVTADKVVAPVEHKTEPAPADKKKPDTSDKPSPTKG